jgi:hypothetical protein
LSRQKERVASGNRPGRRFGLCQWEFRAKDTFRGALAGDGTVSPRFCAVAVVTDRAGHEDAFSSRRARAEDRPVSAVLDEVSIRPARVRFEPRISLPSLGEAGRVSYTGTISTSQPAARDQGTIAGHEARDQDPRAPLEQQGLITCLRECEANASPTKSPGTMSAARGSERRRGPLPIAASGPGQSPCVAPCASISAKKRRPVLW